MRGRRWAAAAAAVAIVAGGTAVVRASLGPDQVLSPVGLFTLCVDAQTSIAKIDSTELTAQGIIIKGEILDLFENPVNVSDPTSFVGSKSRIDLGEPGNPTATPPVPARPPAIITTAYVSVENGRPTQVRCKMRTSESLAKGPETAGYNPLYPFGFGPVVGANLSDGPGTCDTIQWDLIKDVWASLTPEEQAGSPYPVNPNDQAASRMRTLPDQVEAAGPLWTSEFDGVETDPVDGDVTIRSKSLIAPSGAIGNARLEGAHYCTFIAPQYLEAILLGQASA